MFWRQAGNDHPTPWGLDRLKNPIDSVELRANYVWLGHDDTLDANLMPIASPGVDLGNINEYEYNVIHDDVS